MASFLLHSDTHSLLTRALRREAPNGTMHDVTWSEWHSQVARPGVPFTPQLRCSQMQISFSGTKNRSSHPRDVAVQVRGEACGDAHSSAPSSQRCPEGPVSWLRQRQHPGWENARQFSRTSPLGEASHRHPRPLRLISYNQIGTYDYQKISKFHLKPYLHLIFDIPKTDHFASDKLQREEIGVGMQTKKKRCPNYFRSIRLFMQQIFWGPTVRRCCLGAGDRC